MNRIVAGRSRPAAIAWILFSAAVAGAAALLPLGASGQTTSRAPTLEQRLTFGLQARLPSEIAFVQAVVDTVNRGELPVRIVDRTFFYSRRRSQRSQGRVTRRPILYFQRVLLLQTDRLGITITANP